MNDRRHWLICLAALSTGSMVACAGAFVFRGGNMPDVNFTLHARHTRIVAGGNMEIELRIENGSARPLRIPNPLVVYSRQPEYTLKFPDGHRQTFNPSSLSQNGPAKERPPLIIPAGETWVGDLVLQRYIELKLEGEYELSASIEWGDAHLLAESVRFSVAASQLSRLVISQCGGEEVTQVAVLLQGAGEKSAVFQVINYGGIMPRSLQLNETEALGNVPRDTKELSAIEGNHWRAHQLFSIAVGSREIRVADPIAGKSVIVPSSKVILRGLRALLTFDEQARRIDGNLFAVLAGDGPELGFAHIQNVDRAPSAMAMRSIESLGAGWVGAQTALGTVAQGSPMFVASLSRHDSVARLRLLRVTPKGRIGARTQVDLPGHVPLGAVSMIVADESHVDVAFVTSTGAEEKELGLVTIAASVSLATTEPPVVSTSPWLEPVREILVQYGRTEPSRSPAVFWRMAEGSSYFYRRESGLTRNPFRLAERDEVALLGVGTGWYAIINDGVAPRLEKLGVPQ